MALNVGQGFKQRWLDAPEALRQGILDELYRVCDLLHSASDISQWQDHDQRAMQIAQLNIEQAYATQKADLIEAAKQRKQHKLERSLAEKRSLQQHFAAQLQQSEVEQYRQQTQELKHLGQQIAEDARQYSARYMKNPTTQRVIAALDQDSQQRLIKEIENIRIRLELEAETLIDQAFSAFKQKLQLAAHEEIQFIVAQSPQQRDDVEKE